MNLLILGGTVFLGRHIVAAALKAGHSVTTFNRGTHSLEEQDAVEKLYGDRAKDLSKLQNRLWDAVVDTCGYEKEIVWKSAEMLNKSIENYVFISSISAYKTFPSPGMTESAPLKSIQSGDEIEYGSLKVDCERAVNTVFKDRSIVIRPGLIVGPHDPTDRFTYWPWRISKGGTVIAPGDPERQIQFIDVRDLAEWIVRLVEERATGTFNATGPRKPLTMRQFLNECNAVGGNFAKFAWLSDADLAKAEVKPWMEMPLWINPKDKDYSGFLSIDCSKAQKAGLKYSALWQTITDTLKWCLSREASHEWKAGLTVDKEAELMRTFSGPG